MDGILIWMEGWMDGRTDKVIVGWRKDGGVDAGMLGDDR